MIEDRKLYGDAAAAADKEEQRNLLSLTSSLIGVVNEASDTGKDIGARKAAIGITYLIDNLALDLLPEKSYTGKEIIDALDAVATEIYIRYIKK